MRKWFKRYVSMILVSLMLSVGIFSASAISVYAQTWNIASEYDGLSADIRGNCVAFARYMVPSLPSGLGTYQEKKNIINSSTPAPGNIAISYGNSELGHVSYVESVNGNQITTLNGGFSGKVNEVDFTGHIVRITGTASELGIDGYWNPGSEAGIAGRLTNPVDTGDDFYGGIIFANSGKALTVQDNDNVVLSTNWGLRNQVFHFTRNSDLSYRIVSCQNNKSLDVYDAKDANGTNIWTFNSWEHNAQYWYFYQFAEGKFFFVSKMSSEKRCLDVAGGNTADGTNIQLWTPNSSGTEFFYITKYSAPSSITPSVSVSAQDATVAWTANSNNNKSFDLTLKSGGNVVETVTTQNTSYTWQNLPNASYSVVLTSKNAFAETVGTEVYFEIANSSSEENDDSQKVPTIVDLSSAAANTTIESISAKTYTGSALKPSPAVGVSVNGKTVYLIEGTDYTLTYKNNTKVGTATVTVNGIGNYTGSVEKKFEIIMPSGIAQASNGNWYYYKNNNIQKKTDVVQGKVNGTEGRWYVNSAGKVDTSFSGMAKSSDQGWLYITKGKWDTGYTGMAKNTYGWWYMKNGKLDQTYTGMAKNAYGWWYMKNGRLDQTYTGMAKNAYGWWYMKNGKLDQTYTGMAKNAYGWWYMKNGKLDQTYTGMAKNAYGWWYMKNGKLDTTFTGIAQNEYGSWYMMKGKLASSYNGKVTYNSKTYTVKNGKATKI